MRIAIITFHRAYNYGAVLQCYALYRTLKKLGHECYVLDYWPKYFYNEYYVHRDFLLTHPPVKTFLNHFRARNIIKDRNQGFENFLKDYLELMPISIVGEWEYFSVKRIQPKVFKRVSTYSIPLIPNNLAWWVVNASDRTIIAHFLGTAANGIYSIANKFPNVFINFYNILNLSWTETVSLHYGDEDRDEFLTETMTSLFKLFAAACFGIVACMPFIFPILINTKYDAAYNQILILMYAMLFRVLVGLYSCVYVAQKNAKKIAYTSISAAIINITVDLILINKIQVFAASVSTLVAFLSMFVIRYIDVNKTVHMKIRKPIIVGSVLIGGMLIGTYYCGNKIIQFVALCITAIYAMLTNVDMLKSGVNLVKSRLGK